MTGAVSASSNFIQSQSLIASGQQELSKLSEQLSTGQNGQSLSDYGTQAGTLLNLQSSQQSEQAFINNNKQIQTYLTAYDATLAQLQSDATTLQKVLTSTQTSSSTSLTNLTTAVNGLLVDATATLNTQVGNRYLFSGTRYSTQPVVNLSNLTPLTTPPAYPPTLVPNNVTVTGAANNGSGAIRLTVASTAGLTTGNQIAVSGVTGTTEANGTWTVTVISPTQIDLQSSTFTNAYVSGGAVNGALPAYDTQASTGAANAAAASSQQTAVVAQNEPTVSYGVTSTDPTIQTLVYALQNAKAATAPGVTAAQQQQYLSNATNAIADVLNGSQTNSAVTGITGLLSGQDNTEGTVAAANAVHTQTLATLQTQSTNITAIDSAKIATEISALQTQLQSTYKVTASTLNLSILNYIS